MELEGFEDEMHFVVFGKTTTEVYRENSFIKTFWLDIPSYQTDWTIILSTFFVPASLIKITQPLEPAPAVLGSADPE